MIRRVLSIAAVALFLTTAGHLAAAEKNPYNEKYNDPDTPEIRASFTTVPETDDIKVLREFIKHGELRNRLESMMGRYKDYDDYEEFFKEQALAQIEAADKMLAICEKQNNTALPQPMEREHFFFNQEKDIDADYFFALKSKISGFSGLSRDNEWLQKFDEYAKSFEGDPAKKDVALMARASWLSSSFYNAWLQTDPDQAVERFQSRGRLLKEFIAAYADLPYSKYNVDNVFFIQRQCAGLIEDSPKSKIKKGTLMIPVLEFQRSWYAVADLPDKGWVEHHNRELVKYRILASDDPMAAFRKAVDEKKAELEKNLDKDSRMNTWE